MAPAACRAKDSATLRTTAYTAANELTQWGTANLFYDANGNMTSDGANSFVWNARNQLASMNASLDTFQYDPFGRRVSRTISSATTSYLYDGLNPVQELSGGLPTANLVTGLKVDEHFLRTDSSGARNFLTDPLGSTFSLADSTGALQTTYTYEAFGNTTVTGQANANPYQYTGRENDGTGLYFYRARYYNPMFGRFVSQDPAACARKTNLYAYVGDAPTKFVDPLGLSRKDPMSSPPPSFGGLPPGPADTCSGCRWVLLGCEISCVVFIENPPLLVTCEVGCHVAYESCVGRFCR